MVCSCRDFRDASNRQFNAEKAAKELQAYQKGRLGPTTRLMRDGVVALGLNRGSLLDIGGGVGALTFELLDRGTTTAVVADASAAYAAAARTKPSAAVERSQRPSFMETYSNSPHNCPPRISSRLTVLCAAIQHTNRCSRRPHDTLCAVSPFPIPATDGSYAPECAWRMHDERANRVSAHLFTHRHRCSR
jgi:hypothetical protein